MCMRCAALRPQDASALSATHSSDSSGVAGATAAASGSQLGTLANYLRSGFWSDQDDGARKFDIQVGDTLTYDVTGLSRAEKFIAVSALQAWTDVSGIKFKAINHPDLRQASEGTDAKPDQQTTYSLGLNTEFHGSLSTGSDKDEVRVTLTAGVDYYALLNRDGAGGRGLDVVLELRRANGEVVMRSDNPDANDSEALAFRVDQGGTYYLTVSSFNNASDGDYELTFKKAADFVFDNWDDGAYSYSDLDGGDRGAIHTSIVNVPNNWDTKPISLNSYWLQTYIHEIGHGLGLGHAGDYNGNAQYGPDHTFKFDSWQSSIMSYFAQSDNPNVNASFGFIATAMAADILAIQSIYGTNVQTRAGNTVYGANSNVNGYLGNMFDEIFDLSADKPRIFNNKPYALTIYDTGGVDLLNFSTATRDQRINLNDTEASSIGGRRGNVVIAQGVVIENAIGGKRSDVMIGNEVENRLWGRNGADQLNGKIGSDTLNGGEGNDVLNGGFNSDTIQFSGREKVAVNLSRTGTQNTGEGRDKLISIENIIAGGGNDRLIGSDGDNRLSGGAGRDLINGGQGNDVLIGGSGNDVLRGQGGNDTLTGGGGSDVFVYLAGLDSLTDFVDDDDTVQISLAALGLAGRTIDEILALATTTGADAVFDFGSANILTIVGVTDLESLRNDLLLT